MKRPQGIASQAEEDFRSNLLMSSNHQICARPTFDPIYHLEREHWRWKEGLSPVALRFRRIEALLQSLYEAQVCEVCAERAGIEDLRARDGAGASSLVPGDGQEDIF